jgi:hypothetical protein
MTLLTSRLVGVVVVTMGLVSGCIIKEDDDPEENGNGGTGAGPVGTSGAGGDPTDTRGGAGGGASTAAAADCDQAEVLPAAIEADLSIGPGCVRVETTVVDGAARLSIAPGTRLEFAPGGYLSVGRFGGTPTLSAVGTPEAPITFTSSNPNPRAGDWQCIHLDGDGSELDHVIVEYGGAACAATGAGREGMVQVYGSARGITNSTFSDSSTFGIHVGGAPTLFENNSFQRNALAPIRASSNSLANLGTPNEYDEGDVILVEGDLVTRDGTWRNQGVPYRFLSGFGAQGAITVAAGVVIQMTDGTLDVGTFDLLGTEEAPVVITSAQENPEPGDWGCINSSVALRIEHAVIEYGGSGQGCTGGGHRVALNVNGGTPISDTIFRNIAGSAIRSPSCEEDLSGWCSNTFEGIAEPILCSDQPGVCP